MANDALRFRVERLLRDDFHVEDFSKLFLAMRGARSGGRETIDEVGDFIAHQDVRNKGITTRCVRDFFAMVRYKIPDPKRPIDLTDLSPGFIDVLWATFRRLDVRLMKRDTRLNRKEIHVTLKDIAGRITQDNSGKWFLAWPTVQDENVVRCLSSYIVARPAFDDDQLFEEFSAALISNGLMMRRERKLLVPLKAVIALYAISNMHACTIDLGDGTTAELKAGPSNEGKIAVSATARVLHPDIRHLLVTSPIFTTSIAPTADYCEPELLVPPIPKEWGFPLELTHKKTLARLG